MTFQAEAEFFHAAKKSKDGLNTYCKECAKQRSRDWARANVLRKKQADASYAQRNAERIAEKQKGYREANKEKASEYHRAYREKMSAELKAKRSEYFSRKDVKKRRSEYERKRKDCGKHRMICNIRSAISECMSGKTGALRHLPYTALELRRHIEKQFSHGMTWENYGSHWHVDHILPLASFKIDGSASQEFLACWSLANLRPFPASENMSKQDKRTHLI